MLTGESKPSFKKSGDSVIGGSVNLDGALTVKIQATGKDSYLSQIIDIVKKAHASKSKSQSLADKAAFFLTLIALSFGFLTFAAWLYLKGDFAFALERCVSVMVITCPHALGLAIPLVIAMITTIAAKQGILIQNRIPFEKACKLNACVFDKTGTLTQGNFTVSQITSFASEDPSTILRFAASLENLSEHHLGKAIVKHALDKKISLAHVSDFKATPGMGIVGLVDNHTILVGSYAFLSKKHIKTPKPPDQTSIFIAKDSACIGMISVSDSLRKTSKIAVKRLKKKGIFVSMITGDQNTLAASLARELDLDHFSAEVLPDQKAKEIQSMQKKGYLVAMVGDGINDAPSIAQADVGIALGAGTNIAMETADVILSDSEPICVLDVINLSKLTRKKIIQNLVWATGYNVFAIPLAMGIFGVILPPSVGAIIMSLSTIIVAVNARLIRYKKSDID